MVKRTDYARIAVEAARSVMVEAMHVLAAYRESVVIVGGWVPELLVEGGPPHVGSLDVDLALDPSAIGKAQYRSIERLLREHDYVQEQGGTPFIWHRQVTVAGHRINVELDLLSGEYAETSAVVGHQRVHGADALTARGCDLVFDSPVELQLEGSLPDGGSHSIPVRVAAIAPFITMKCMALAGRFKEKDAWDIYYCLRYFPGGVDAVAGQFEPLLSNGLVREALANLAGKFASVDRVGPRHVALFEGAADRDQVDIVRRDAFETVQRLLQRLGVC
jgi:hypothetical protein